MTLKEKDEMRSFQLTFQSTPRAAKPWRLLENIYTVDGVRTRLTNWCFEGEAEAKAKLAELEGYPWCEVAKAEAVPPAKAEPSVPLALEELLKRSAVRMDAMSPLERAVMLMEQRSGYVSAEWRMNDDASPNGRTAEQAEAMLRKIAPEYLVLDEMRRAQARSARLKAALQVLRAKNFDETCACNSCAVFRQVEDLLG